jgi:hypothetical protein
MLIGRIRTLYSSHASLALCVVGIVATFATGCSSWKSRGEPLHSDDGEKAEGTYYTGQAGVKLYPTPSVSSSCIAVLPLHQKVHRSKLKQGFAYVEVVGSGQAGWVDNGKLIWRLPSSRPSQSGPSAKGGDAAPAPATSSEARVPAATEESAAAPATSGEARAPAATEETSPEPTPPSVDQVPADTEQTESPLGTDPSVFNPF